MIYIELPQLEEMRKRLKSIPLAAEWAFTRTLNDVAISGRQIAVEDITRRYNLGSQTARAGMKILAANPTRLTAVIRISGHRFPVQLFSPRQTAEGVSFEEVRGKPSSISHAFAARMRFGPNVFVRKGTARGPVQMITGLALAGMAREQEEVLPDMERRIKEQLSKRAAFWMQEALAGRMAKYGGGPGE